MSVPFTFRTIDALGAPLALTSPARRIVSLVPSETETLFAIGVGEAVVGRTSYCVEPAGQLDALPAVGGTKDASVEQILALRPDLVLANQEENTPEIVRRLRSAGVAVHVSFPKSVADAIELVEVLCRLVGIDPEHAPTVVAMRRALEASERTRGGLTPVRVFCPIWMEPLMTIHGETFISDMLDLAGAFNVFADRARRYPLAADLGLRPPLPAERITGRDVRYPRVTLAEVASRAPELVLLPSEPHPFSEQDAEVFRALDLPDGGRPRVAFIDGRDLCWYSPRMGEAVGRLARAITAARVAGGE